MKGLKKIALATAIAAAPFATQAGMKALDDTAMGNVTGQRGVTIELETRVSIGKFTYTDEGSFSVSGIELGGSSVASGVAGNELLDELVIDIDINPAGDAVIHVGSMESQDIPQTLGAFQTFVEGGMTKEQALAAVDAGLADGTIDPAATVATTKPIDWGITADSMELTSQDGSQSTTLLSGLSGYGNLAQLDIVVRNDDATRLGSALDANGVLELDVEFNVVDMEFDVDFLGVGISGLSIYGADSDQKKALYQGLGMDETQAGELLKTTSFASAEVDVFKGDGLGSSTMTDVLRIDVSEVAMDLYIEDVVVGGTIGSDLATRSIGSIAMDNLVISDTKLAVYGKD